LNEGAMFEYYERERHATIISLSWHSEYLFQETRFVKQFIQAFYHITEREYTTIYQINYRNGHQLFFTLFKIALFPLNLAV
jgi:hypothetical protein